MRTSTATPLQLSFAQRTKVSILTLSVETGRTQVLTTLAMTLSLPINYRPQQSCGQGYVFTRVCDSVHRGGVSGQTPPWQGEHPPTGTRQTPPRPFRHPPGTRQTPLDQADTPPDQADTPPDQADTPREEDCSIRSMSGRYASYWNAFLLKI